MKRKIMWVSQHLEVDTISGKLKPEDEEKEYEDDEFPEEKIQNIMSTPFGFWRIDDCMNPYKQFKLWMGHTNFTINAKIANIIKCIPGVEVLTILTRYRFMIGVGELFNIRDVRTAIERSLQCTKEEIEIIGDKTLRNEIEQLKQELSVHDKWAIYVFPNGKIEYVTSEIGNKNFNEKLLLYKSAVDYSSGILIENNNE